MLYEVITVKAIEVPEDDEDRLRIVVFVCENDAYPALDMSGMRNNFVQHTLYEVIRGEAVYDDAVIEEVEKMSDSDNGDSDTEYDERYDEAVAIVAEAGQASISMIQRRLRIGYNRAARMIETMEKEGVVGPQDGAKPREVLVKNTY